LFAMPHTGSIHSSEKPLFYQKGGKQPEQGVS
jgi:hypothetical protein